MSETKRRPIPTLGSSPVINGWIQEWGRERAELERVTASLAAAVKAKEEYEMAYREAMQKEAADIASLRSQLAQAREALKGVRELTARFLPAQSEIDQLPDWVRKTMEANVRTLVDLRAALSSPAREIAARAWTAEPPERPREEAVAEMRTLVEEIRSSPASEGVEKLTREDVDAALKSGVAGAREMDVTLREVFSAPSSLPLTAPGASGRYLIVCATCPHPTRCVDEKVCTCNTACPHVGPGVEREEETKR